MSTPETLRSFLKLDDCDHDFSYQGMISKYCNYICSLCGKAYLVNKDKRKPADWHEGHEPQGGYEH